MKPKLLDAFCGAGGCTKGYQEAGFYVVGIDIEPQPNYCGDEFIQADAIEWLRGLVDGPRPHQWFTLGDYAAIHASPPCQDYSRALRHLAGKQPRLIERVRELLIETGLPWVIENVDGAPLPRQSDLMGSHGTELCGTMFGLRVYRHRLFEASFPIAPPRGCDHRLRAMNPHNGAGRAAIGYAPETRWREEMGVPWMNKDETRQAVPPAMTEHIGHFLLAHLEAESKLAA